MDCSFVLSALAGGLVYTALTFRTASTTTAVPAAAGDTGDTAGKVALAVD